MGIKNTNPHSQCPAWHHQPSAQNPSSVADLVPQPQRHLQKAPLPTHGVRPRQNVRLRDLAVSLLCAELMMFCVVRMMVEMLLRVLLMLG